MKIGIDARLYGTKHAGIGRYTEQIIKHLEKIDNENEYFVFLQNDGFESYVPQNPNFKKILADFKVYSLSEQIKYPELLNKHKFDFVYFTHFNVPIFYRKSYVVTIHDLIISHYPSTRATTLNPLLYAIKLFFYRMVVKSSAKRAKKIIAVSKYTKDDIVKLLDIKSEKIKVIYEGVELPLQAPQNCHEILNSHGIKEKFLLYVGSAYPHKNLEKLILAFSDISKQKSELQLVLVGKNNFFYQRLKEFAKENCDIDVLEKIIFTGYANDDDLVCLYKNALLYVFPSLIEGFGLPPLEAQNYGLPVVGSNATCLPEILAESAKYFDPNNIKDIEEKIIDLIDNDEQKQKLVILGYENLKRFSWDNCAKEILDIFNSLK